MKSIAGIILSVMVALSLVSSCATTQQLQLKSGELRLIRVDMPEVISEDLPYDVVVTFAAQGRPEIKRACFRWFAETTNVKSPSLYCYATEVQDNAPIGSSCARWLAEGKFSASSPLFCANVVSVNYDETPGRFIVKIQSRNIQQAYNKLECYAEYEVDGEMRETNRVSARVRVEQ